MAKQKSRKPFNTRGLRLFFWEIAKKTEYSWKKEQGKAAIVLFSHYINCKLVQLFTFWLFVIYEIIL